MSSFWISILFPFLEARWVDLLPMPLTFWSFRVREPLYLRYGFVARDWWFADFWYRMNGRMGALQAWTGPALLLTLEMQVLTLFLTGIAMIKVEPYKILSAAITSGCTGLLMWFVGLILSTSYTVSYQAGFWLTMPSAVFFMAASILAKSSRRRTYKTSASDGVLSPAKAFV